MKPNSIVKIIVVFSTITVLGYIVYSNNRAARVNDIVNTPIERYNLELYVDSVCDVIKVTNDLSRSKTLYNLLYEEMDVYANIAKDDGTSLIDEAIMTTAFSTAFNVYFPHLEKDANMLFETLNWTPNKNPILREEINRLIDCNGRGSKRGMNNSQVATLKRFQGYYKGYYSFSRLLGALENCTDSMTYMRYSGLSNYRNAPYDKLKNFQSRRFDAQDNAKNNWHETIKKEGNALINRYVPITIEAIQQFSDDSDDWKRKMESYCNTTRENDFVNLKSQIEEKYRNLVGTLTRQLYN